MERGRGEGGDGTGWKMGISGWKRWDCKVCGWTAGFYPQIVKKNIYILKNIYMKIIEHASKTYIIRNRDDWTFYTKLNVYKGLLFTPGSRKV